MPHHIASTKRIYPIEFTCYACKPSHTYLILGNIFDELAVQLFPIALPILYAKPILEKKHHEDHSVTGVLKVFGNDYTTQIIQDQDDALWIKTMIDTYLSEYLANYFRSLGVSHDLRNRYPTDDQINWVSAADQVFQLGRFFFENNVEALTTLGGQKWIKQQPEDIQQIINAHLKSIQTESWLSRVKKSLRKYANYAKQEVRYYLRK